MRIGLLTMVFNNNYGGMMQAYALQNYLKSLGHEVVLINAQVRNPPLWKVPFSIARRLIMRVLFRRSIDSIIPNWAYYSQIKKREVNTSGFVTDYIIPKTKIVFSNKGIKNVCKGFDSYIIGSDQVWRPTMYPFINSAFFGFIKDKKIKKISYAASFGVENWEYTVRQTEMFSKEVEKFNAVSVREKSGVELCNNYFGIEASQVLDPTLLISMNQYIKLIPESEFDSVKPELFCYILDYTTEKSEIAKSISKSLDLKESHFLFENNGRDFQYPSVTEWLASFLNSKFVFTDSYHGCLFSLIFQKPFIVIGNKVRGMERFNSLLSQFCLYERLVLSIKDLGKVDLSNGIDWERVSGILNEQIIISKEFLNRALKE